MDGQAVGDVAAGAVDVEGDRPVARRWRAREAARCSCAPCLSRCRRSGRRRAAGRPALLAQLCTNGIDELGDQCDRQFAHRRIIASLIGGHSRQTCQSRLSDRLAARSDRRPRPVLDRARSAQSPNVFQVLLIARQAADRRTRRGCGRATAGAAESCRRACAGSGRRSMPSASDSLASSKAGDRSFGHEPEAVDERVASHERAFYDCRPAASPRRSPRRGRHRAVQLLLVHRLQNLADRGPGFRPSSSR